MSEYSAKTLREKAKARARALANPGSYAKDQEVSSADWSPAEPLNADVKTGARPVGKGARLYKRGGKVAGSPSKARADRKPQPQAERRTRHASLRDRLEHRPKAHVLLSH
jgi:hypothetical protein